MSLWDLYQHAQIRGLQRDQDLAENLALLRDRSRERSLEEIEERLEQLGTLVEAMWTLCRERLELTDEQLVTRVDEVLERRKAEAVPVRCPKCDAAIGRELDRCQFCGGPSPRPKSAFGGL